jgi:hypothetical protein
MPDTANPRYTGLRIASGVGFSLAHPIEWVTAQSASDGPGIVLAMDPEDPHTLFAVEVIDLAEPITADDADVLHQELTAAVDLLPGATRLRSETLVAGLLRGADIRYDFNDPSDPRPLGEDTSTRRRRWVRILVERTRQLTVTAQGSTPERFDYWESQFFTTMASVRIHQGGTPPSSEELRS